MYSITDIWGQCTSFHGYEYGFTWKYVRKVSVDWVPGAISYVAFPGDRWSCAYWKYVTPEAKSFSCCSFLPVGLRMQFSWVTACNYP